jgi:glycosyltransferase involved in cell wall biosynthesis
LKTPITVIYTTFNEADIIERSIDSVKWADEIIVVDSFSTDNTFEILERLGVPLFQRKYVGPADQKNWAIPQAKYEWILLMDADEILTEELSEEIKQVIDSNTEIAAFKVPRKNNFDGRWLPHLEKPIRLIKRDICRYNDNQVHEIIETSGQIGKLKHFMWHYPFKSMEHFIDKQLRYARWSSIDHAKKVKSVGYFHLLVKPMFRFFKHYLMERNFLLGKTGFVFSTIMAYGVFMRYVYMKEMRKINA